MITVEIFNTHINISDSQIKMAFSEQLKLGIRRRSHFKCCVCRALGIEIHHIIPQENNGADTEDNAAPLCPTCHATYGDNPKKKKFIRESRDFWYELCDRNLPINPYPTKELESLVKNTASKNELAALHEDVRLLSKKINSNTNTTAKEKSNKGKELPIEKYIAHLFDTDYKYKNDLYDILFDSRSWYESGDDEYALLDKRREFLSLYGVETARRLCLKVQNDLKFNPSAFTEENFAYLIHTIHVEVLLILWNEKFSTDEISLTCLVSEDGNFAWRKKAKHKNPRPTLKRKSKT